MKKSLFLLILSLQCVYASAQDFPFPYQGLNLLPVESYYAEIGLNTAWHGVYGWRYLKNGPCAKLRMGEWNYSSDFVFETAPVNANGADALVTFTEVMRIRQNGSVGIGTTNPGSHKLAVEGSIGARIIKVTQNGWADFVFSPAYKLPSLHDVETHVKRYSHLPGIPSAEEIAQEGLDLGDMQKKQMQKIEELTLYVIDLNKKLESQQAVITEQRRELEELKKKVERK